MNILLDNFSRTYIFFTLEKTGGSDRHLMIANEEVIVISKRHLTFYTRTLVSCFL